MICPTTIVILFAGMTLLPIDEARMRTHAEICVKHFPAKPCLIKWSKVTNSDYRVICGAKVPE